MTSKSSKFHWLLGPASGHGPTALDVVVRETEHFAVMPSIGSIVPGWLLVVPKFPVSRMAEVGPSYAQELNALVDDLVFLLQHNYGQVFSFEHGGERGSRVSCGVDQAHLHLVPLPFDLLASARAEPDFKWRPAAGSVVPRAVPTDHEYLFVSSTTESYYSRVSLPVSQWFRKLIAKEMGCEDMWDYKEYAFSSNLLDTIDRIGAHG